MSRSDIDRAVAEAINANAGTNIQSVYDLVAIRSDYPKLVPMLCKLVSDNSIEDSVILEGVVRALRVPSAKGVANAPLLALFHRTPKAQTTLRWAIGYTMKLLVLPKERDDLLAIVRDTTNGTSRQEFVCALGCIADRETEEALLQLLDDDDVAAQGLETLRKIKSPIGVSRAVELVQHNRALISTEAKKYLASQYPQEQREPGNRVND